MTAPSIPRAADDFFVVTCEHGGNRIPPQYRALFAGGEAVLRTHRGYDAGALSLARELADTLQAPMFISTVSRLVIDLNRSPRHPRLYSEFTRPAPAPIRQEILRRYYLTYRVQVETCIAQAIARGQRVVHLSSHSFTPQLNGVTRNADIGFLYDPARASEADFCRRWQTALRNHLPQCKTRLNYPYAGTSDGFPVYLRRCFTAQTYLGMELELNQKHIRSGGRHWREVRTGVLDALRETIAIGQKTHPLLPPSHPACRFSLRL